MKNILWAVAAAHLCLFLPDPAISREAEHIVRCESDDFTRQQCRLPPAPRGAEIKEIRMVRQLSSRPCIEGKTWEASSYGITVTGGCRADFRVVYQDRDRRDRYDHQRQYGDRDGYGYRDRGPEDRSYRPDEATDIVLRAFADILNRRPTREELREYRYLIMERDWTERQVRRDLRRRSDSEGRY